MSKPIALSQEEKIKWMTRLLSKAKLVGFASLIDRSTKKNLKIKKKIISQVKIDVPTYKKNKLPLSLKNIPVTTPGSRFIND